ncbi:MAG: carboxypeptidase regulatory-like domain-containing protein [Chitinophagaceae bacterium]
MRCHRVLIEGDCRPLWLLDGVIKGLDSFASINPNDIMDVTILKHAEATALFGPDGVNGVICITTKKYILRHLAIKDFTNGKPIPGATVSFISKSKNDTLFFKANDSGIVTTNKLRPGATYSIRVSSIGYKTLQQDFVNTGKQYPKDILLAKDIKTCEEAILSVISCPRKISCGGYVRFTRKVQSEQKETGVSALQIKGYPNPVSKGAALTIQWKDVEKAVVELRLVSLDGRTVLRQPVTNKEAGNLQLSTDPRWASGLYFLQIICEKGRVLASEKISIQ